MLKMPRLGPLSSDSPARPGYTMEPRRILLRRSKSETMIDAAPESGDIGPNPRSGRSRPRCTILHGPAQREISIPTWRAR